MKAEIIATGREILSGDIVDTNTNFLTEKLSSIGLDVTHHHVVGDEELDLSDLMIHASERSEIIIVSGGLGPTDDDKSRLAASIATGSELELNEEALKYAKDYFIKRKIEMPPININQAVIPKISTPFENEMGTAPGFYFKLNMARVYFLPGVPHEFKEITNSFLIDDIRAYLGLDEDYINRKFTIFGLPESEVGTLVSDFYEIYKSDDDLKIDLGIQAVFPEIYIKIYGRSKDKERLSELVKDIEKYIIEKFGKNIISMDGKTIAERAAELLTAKKATLSIAESCTGGLISNLMTNISGSSAYFNFAATTYSNQAKMDILGVKQETLEKFGAVSAETAYELAEGVRKKGQSDYSVSTTGIAGPTGGVPGKDVGTVYIGISTPEKTWSTRFERDFKDRNLNKKIFCAVALYYLINELEK